MIRKGLRPQFKIVLDLPGDRKGFRQVLPFQRSWIAIGILAVFDIVFLVPAVTTFLQAVHMWSQPGDLFNLVGALFTTFWLMGWLIGPFIMTLILALLLFGREVLRAEPGKVEIFLGLPFIGLLSRYDANKIRNLRIEKPTGKSGKTWRGSHATFDYGANSGEFGSNIDAVDLVRIESGLEMSTGVGFRRGEARPEDLQGEWEPDALITALSDARGETVVDVVGVRAPVSLGSPSTVLLILANLVPIVGAVLWGWDLGNVMVLYWAESAVIGFFNLCKIVVIGRWVALLMGPFFIGHFGGFMAVHFLFLYTLFVKDPQQAASGSSLTDVAQLFVGLWPALLALFLSHAYSFFANFMGRREYRGRGVGKQMSEPYSRIVFMHLVLIFGGGLTLLLGGATPVLINVIVLQIAFDIRAHLKQRSAGQEVFS